MLDLNFCPLPGTGEGVFSFMGIFASWEVLVFSFQVGKSNVINFVFSLDLLSCPLNDHN
jgi:hypothetical protein